jgi:phage shock protein PspC (stress-responsive transcriptional regulator)
MKKIININLSGRVIPIEDAAYESLQKYIDSLRRYFAYEEGRDEIINDIESRVAELMNDKVKKGAPAVTESDINEIITAMGRVEDFEEVEAATATGTGTGNTTATADTTQSKSQPFAEMKLPRGRLYRDTADKMIGGVCSGIANYLNIDPALVRILFVLLTFGAGMSILVYILLWIIIPKKALEPVKTKRLFRNPDDRILGGVAGGIGAYFNKEPWMIRLIFAAPLLLNILFGIIRGVAFPFHGNPFPNFFIGSFTVTFFITYVILWIILPEAKGTYEKMEMRGEHVDVNKIRENVKSEMQNIKTMTQSWGEEVKETAQNFSNQAKEFAGTTGKTFAANISDATRPVRSGAGYVIGLLLKIFIVFVLGCFALFFFFALLFFVFGGVGELANNFLLDGAGQQFLAWTSAILILGVPMMALITWLVRRIMKVRTHNRYLGITFGTLWVLGVILGLWFAGSMVRSFRSSNGAPSEEVSIFQPKNKLTVMVQEPEIEYNGDFGFLDDNNHNERGWDIVNDSLKVSNVELQIAKSEDSLYHVTIWKFSRGSNRAEAEQKAKQIAYAVTSMDSAINLANGFGIGKDTKFRGQKVVVSIRVPVGKMIRFDPSVRERLNQWHLRLREGHDRYRNRRSYDLDWDFESMFEWKSDVDYLMNEDGQLLDTTQPLQKNEKGVYEYRKTKDSLNNDDRGDDLRDERNGVDITPDTTPVTPRKKTAQQKPAEQSTAKIASPVFSLII